MRGGTTSEANTSWQRLHPTELTAALRAQPQTNFASASLRLRLRFRDLGFAFLQCRGFADRQCSARANTILRFGSWPFECRLAIVALRYRRVGVCDCTTNKDKKRKAETEDVVDDQEDSSKAELKDRLQEWLACLLQVIHVR